MRDPSSRARVANGRFGGADAAIRDTAALAESAQPGSLSLSKRPRPTPERQSRKMSGKSRSSGVPGIAA